MEYGIVKLFNNNVIHSSVKVQMGSVLFCDVTQLQLAVNYRRFGTTCLAQLQG